jgi:hypothetical protein
MCGSHDDDGRDDESGGVSRTTQYDRTTTEPSTVIVETIAAVRECEPTAITPLFDSVDPDALDALLTTPHSDTDVEVTLALDGFDVTVSPDYVTVET